MCVVCRIVRRGIKRVSARNRLKKNFRVPHGLGQRTDDIQG